MHRVKEYIACKKYLAHFKINEYMKKTSKLIVIILMLSLLPLSGNAQKSDTTSTREPYKYKLPILGKKAYAKGYNFPLPHGVLFGTLYNKQGILLKDFEMAIADPGSSESELDFKSLESQSVFSYQLEMFSLVSISLKDLAGASL